jgi:flagella basal body P-ring formation protein FlgA
MARALEATAPERRSGGMIIAAVVFAALAAILLFVALQNRGDGGGGGSAVADTSVVVAKQNINANTKLTADLLEVRAVSVDDALAGAYRTMDAAIG